MPERRPRVMQSFKPPRSTTNPYIVMLDRALAVEPSIEHVRFSWRDALLTRIDVIHLHWPEVALEGNAAWKRLGKRMLMRLFIAKMRLGRTAIVRTVHNLELPQDIDSATRRLLQRLHDDTDYLIVLNDTTAVSSGKPAVLIPHGHYRDWFAQYEKNTPTPHRLGYFGLIRRYKGVETLLSAYESAVATDSELTLSIGGRPSTADLAESIRDAAARLPGITTTLRFLEDSELVAIATSAQLVVLPYRFMHNSGGALASLSLDRPVLLPRNDVNEALSEEVGPGWVHLYDGELTGARVLEAIAATTSTSGSPDLSARNWDGVGARYARVYRAASDERRRRS